MPTPLPCSSFVALAIGSSPLFVDEIAAAHNVTRDAVLESVAELRRRRLLWLGGSPGACEDLYPPPGVARAVVLEVAAEIDASRRW